MSFFYKGTALNGYRDSAGTAGNATTGSTWPMNSGIFLSSLAPVNGLYSSSSPTSYGMLLQYGQSKQVTHNADMVATIYHGRTYPSVEHGKYHFLTLQCSYKIPPNNLHFGIGGGGFGGVSQYYPGRGFDGTRGWMTLTHIHNAQLAIQTGGTAVPPSVTQLQDIWGRRSSQATGAPGGLVGLIYNLQFEDLVNPGGWQTVTFTFSETGIGFP